MELDTTRGTGFLTLERLREQRWAEMERSFSWIAAERADTSKEAEAENTSLTLPRHPGSSTASMAELCPSRQGDGWHSHRR